MNEVQKFTKFLQLSRNMARDDPELIHEGMQQVRESKRETSVTKLIS